MPKRSAVNLDAVNDVPTGWLTERLGRLSVERMHQVCRALMIAVGCSADLPVS